MDDGITLHLCLKKFAAFAQYSALLMFQMLRSSMLLFHSLSLNEYLHNFVIKCQPAIHFGIDNVDICI